MSRPGCATCLSLLAVAVTCAGCGGNGGSPDRAPVLLTPRAGEATGSIWSTRPAPNALRPLFRWTAVAGADAYELDVDDSCPGAGDCQFPSPEIHERVAATSFTPAANLPVEMTPPVGRRYHWRVRACTGNACHSWSEARVFDAGRQRQDFNGDGYADLAVVSVGTPNAVTVFWGGAQFPTAPAAWSISGSAQAGFTKVVWVGDMNGDGFAELAARVDTTTGQSLIRVFAGATAPPASPAVEVKSPEAFASYVWLMKAVGDVNGDGFADLFYAWPGAGDQEAYNLSYGGSPTPVETNQVLTAAPPNAISACDLDADGFTDLIESPFYAGDVPGESRAFKGAPGGPFANAATEPVPTPAGTPIACVANANGTGGASLLVASVISTDVAAELTLQSSDVPAGARDCGGLYAVPSLIVSDTGIVDGGGVADLDDMDGDGYGDVSIGQPSANRAIVLWGGCPGERFLVLPGTADLPGTPHAGQAVAGAGDIDGDGYPDLAVANLYTVLDRVSAGQVYVHRGGPTFGSVPDFVLLSPDNAGKPLNQLYPDGFGASVD